MNGENMTLPASGVISLGNATGDTTTISVNRELGKASPYQQTISLNDAAVRTLLGVASGGISMSTAYGRLQSTVTIAASTNNYVANTAKISGYVAGKTVAIFVINSGVIMGSSNPANYGFTVDTSWNASDKVFIINNGYIVGIGGTGGSGAQQVLGPGSVGVAGGPALSVQRATTITNNGTIGGGGGGGGGGGTGGYTDGKTYFYGFGGGGGGGAGSNQATGGLGSAYTGVPNSPGGTGGTSTLTTGGTAGTATSTTSSSGGLGGLGGSLGTAGTAGGNGSGAYAAYVGGAGGAAGACTSGNANITWLATGTRYGGLG